MPENRPEVDLLWPAGSGRSPRGPEAMTWAGYPLGGGSSTGRIHIGHLEVLKQQSVFSDGCCRPESTVCRTGGA